VVREASFGGIRGAKHAKAEKPATDRVPQIRASAWWSARCASPHPGAFKRADLAVVLRLEIATRASAVLPLPKSTANPASPAKPGDGMRFRWNPSPSRFSLFWEAFPVDQGHLHRRLPGEYRVNRQIPPLQPLAG